MTSPPQMQDLAHAPLAQLCWYWKGGSGLCPESENLQANILLMYHLNCAKLKSLVSFPTRQKMAYDATVH